MSKRVSSHLVAVLFGASISYAAVYKKIQRKEMENGSSSDANSVKSMDDYQYTSTHKHDFSDSSVRHHHQIDSGGKWTAPLLKSPISIFNPNPNLQIAFDARTKNPIYVVEHFPPPPPSSKSSSKSPSGPSSSMKNKDEIATRGNKTFYEEKSLPESHRSRNSHYRKSGYDKGHMAAAANYKYAYNDDGKNVGDQMMKDTFTLTNASPQTPVMNRIVWSRLEHMVRQLMTKELALKNGKREGYIISGPLWLPRRVFQNETKDHKTLYQYEYAGFGDPPVLVQVPTHFFKVIFTKSTSNGDLDKFAAFVVPNDSFELRDEVNLQRDFLVRLTDLEAVTGIVFFPDDVSGNRDMLDLITENMWMEDNGSHNKGDDPQVKGNKLLVSSGKMTKGRVTSAKKKLRKLKNDGEVIPKHFCAGERCDINIKIRK